MGGASLRNECIFYCSFAYSRGISEPVVFLSRNNARSLSKSHDSRDTRTRSHDYWEILQISSYKDRATDNSLFYLIICNANAR